MFLKKNLMNIINVYKYFSDICWYDKILFINTNTTFLYVYNSSIQPSLAKLPNITMATSIAIDWFAPKLYWSSAVQQMVIIVCFSTVKSDLLLYTTN